MIKSFVVWVIEMATRVSMRLAITLMILSIVITLTRMLVLEFRVASMQETIAEQAYRLQKQPQKNHKNNL
jgi:hypothetical protein